MAQYVWGSTPQSGNGWINTNADSGMTNAELDKLREDSKHLADLTAAPKLGAYQSIVGADGKLLPQYQMGTYDPLSYQEIGPLQQIQMQSNLGELQNRLNGIQLNTQGLEAIRQRALSQGPSTWANMMLESQGVQDAMARDKSAQSIANQSAQAGSQLAMRGGLAGGARERLAMQAGRDQSMAAQDLARQAQLNRLGILTTDENQRLDLLKQLPGMEVQALQPELQKQSMWQQMAQQEQNNNLDLQKSNIGFDLDRQKFNTSTGLDVAAKNRQAAMDLDKLRVDTFLKDKAAQDAWNTKNYEEQMKGYGANKTAQATEAAGK